MTAESAVLMDIESAILGKPMSESRHLPMLFTKVSGDYDSSTIKILVKKIRELTSWTAKPMTIPRPGEIEKQVLEFAREKGLAVNKISDFIRKRSEDIRRQLGPQSGRELAALTEQDPMVTWKTEPAERYLMSLFASGVVFNFIEIESAEKRKTISVNQAVIQQFMQVGDVEFLRRCNQMQLHRLVCQKETMQAQGEDSSTGVSKAIDERLKALEELETALTRWFINNGFKLLSGGKKGVRGRGNRKKWKGTKSEFALFVGQQYEKNNAAYSSLRAASYELFSQHVFEDKNWTKEKCYDLVRRM